MGTTVTDSGALAADGKTYEPSGKVSHYVNAQRLKWTREDLRFYAEHLRRTRMSEADRCFLRGYYCHLLLDNLWSHHCQRD